ncbi:MAG: ABC transporter ATP-binding protein [Ignavibacteria bacterium]
MPLIDLKNISFSYAHGSKGSKQDFFLNNISLTIDEGEFLSVLGPNGAGKSTLLRIISGILQPSAGQLMLDNKLYSSISKRNLARIIAFVPQSSLTIFPFSVNEIVMMGRTPYLNIIGHESSLDRQIVDEALEFADIKHLKNKGINEVSGGEAQMAFIARAIVQQPRIILLDEPNAHLDIKRQLSIFNMLRKLNSEKNLTVIAVSHDLNLAGFHSKRIILMKDGGIVHDDLPGKILTPENIMNVFEVDSAVAPDFESGNVSVMIKPVLS